MYMKQPLIVATVIHAPIEKIWKYWNDPEHIQTWAFASDTWHVPKAENDLRVGGRFNTRMETRDKSEGFDFEGTYTTIEKYKKIEYVMDDGRNVRVEFIPQDAGHKIVETFDPEDSNALELQQRGWQAILNNFKTAVETR